jgi:hypothetical protein
MPTTSAEVPQTIIAIASWVKWLAVPVATPGPCEAKAAAAHDKAATAAVAPAAKRDIRCLVRGEVMAISCNQRVAEDTGKSLCRF